MYLLLVIIIVVDNENEKKRNIWNFNLIEKNIFLLIIYIGRLIFLLVKISIKFIISQLQSFILYWNNIILKIIRGLI